MYEVKVEPDPINIFQFYLLDSDLYAIPLDETENYKLSILFIRFLFTIVAFKDDWKTWLSILFIRFEREAKVAAEVLGLSILFIRFLRHLSLDVFGTLLPCFQFYLLDSNGNVTVLTLSFSMYIAFNSIY